MQLFYHPHISENDQQLIFPRDESKHITRVLRKKTGDTLTITNGKGLLFIAEIIQDDMKQCIARIISSEKQPAPPYHLHMIVAPTKMNDRYEWFLEKAMEIGVHEVTPIICENSERKTVKLERYERILQSAMKQSLHSRMPILNEPINFSEFIEKQAEGRKLIAHCEDDQSRKLLQHELKKGENIHILIGPEGDFSPAEIAAALENNWLPVSLGDSRLRTETAAIVACHTVALVNQSS